MVWFAACSTLSVFLFAVHKWWLFTVRGASVMANGAEVQATLGDMFIPAVVLGRALLALGIVWWIVGTASRVAKWIFVIVSATSIVTLPDAWEGIRIGSGLASLWMVAFVTTTVAVILLFLKDSRAWFRHKGRMPEPLNDVFR